jgi:hypothetical protein
MLLGRNVTLNGIADLLAHFLDIGQCLPRFLRLPTFVQGG